MTVGPDAMMPGASPGTSLTASSSRRVPVPRPAPVGRPLMADSDWRTTFDFFNRGATAQQQARRLALVIERNAIGRQRQRRRAAAGEQRQYQVVRPETRDQLEDARAPPVHWPHPAPGDPPRRLRSFAWPWRVPCRVDTSPESGTSGQAASTAAAMARGPPCPHPTTTQRPAGRSGRCAARQRSGSARATATSKSCRRMCRGSPAGSCVPGSLGMTRCSRGRPKSQGLSYFHGVRVANAVVASNDRQATDRHGPGSRTS